jgi:hypothetical protein
MTRPLSPVRRILLLLAAGYTIAEVERRTGWPAAAIRRLIRRQPGLLIGPDGRVYAPEPLRLKPPPAPPVNGEPRPARVLYDELAIRKADLDLAWWQIHIQAHLSQPTVAALRAGTASKRTRRRAEAWLAKTTRSPQEKRKSA